MVQTLVSDAPAAAADAAAADAAAAGDAAAATLASFVDHRVELVVRLQAEQLSAMKKCQLQASERERGKREKERERREG